MDEWRHIETAPKDGTVIRVRQGQWAPFHARWRDGEWRSIEYDGSRFPTLWQPAPISTNRRDPV